LCGLFFAKSCILSHCFKSFRENLAQLVVVYFSTQNLPCSSQNSSPVPQTVKAQNLSLQFSRSLLPFSQSCFLFQNLCSPSKSNFSVKKSRISFETSLFLLPPLSFVLIIHCTVYPLCFLDLETMMLFPCVLPCVYSF
jgi:hypothetical protein